MSRWPNVLKNMRFKQKLILSYLVVSLIPLALLGTYSYNQSKIFLQKQAIQGLQNTVGTLARGMNDKTEQVERTVDSVVMNTGLQRIFGTNYLSLTLLSEDLRNYVSPYFSMIKNLNTDVLQLTVYTSGSMPVNQGAVAEIPQELIEKNAPHYWAWLKKHLGDDPLKFYRRDGKNYSMPIIQTLGPDRTVVGLRKDWLENVGITKNPETLDEFEDALRKFRNNDPDKNGKKDTYGWTGQAVGVKDIFSPVFGAFGVFPGTFTDKDGKVVRGEIEPGAKQALTLLNKWYKEELLDPEFVLNKGQNVDDKIISSKAGIVTASWYQFITKPAFFDGKYYDKLRANVPNANWFLTAGPKGPDGQQGAVQLNPIASSGGQFGKHMENDKEKMAKYLQVADATAFDAETFENIVYGEKGKTYNKGEKGDYKYLPPFDKEEEQIKFGIGQQYTFLGKSFNDYDFQTPYMTLNELMSLRKASEHIGKGKYDIMQPITIAAYNENVDALDQMTLKYYIDIITGQRPVSDFDKYVEEWKKAGGSKVMAEAQKKYEENFKK